MLPQDYIYYIEFDIIDIGDTITGIGHDLSADIVFGEVCNIPFDIHLGEMLTLKASIIMRTRQRKFKLSDLTYLT